MDAVEADITQRTASVDRTRTAQGADDRWFAIVTEPSGVSLGLWTARPS